MWEDEIRGYLMNKSSSENKFKDDEFDSGYKTLQQ